MSRPVSALVLSAAAVAALPSDLTPPFEAAAAQKGDLLWLPLGDSITWGCGTDAEPAGRAGCVPDAGGYRVPMAWALSQRGESRAESFHIV